MISKGFKKIVSCVITTTMMGVMLIAPSNILAVEISSTAIAKAAKARVSVHDPSIVKDGSNYYVFGSHIETAKSTDLKNWTKFTNGYTTPNNVLFGNLSSNLAGSFAWAGENDSDSLGGHSVWAPFVFKNKDYINSNGTKGAYMMYYSTSSTYKRSAIGYAVSQNIEGPYTYVDTILYSGFTKNTAHDANSVIDTKYTNTNIQTLINTGKLTGTNSSWFTSDGSYNTSNCPNAIDPALFYDTEGKLHMVYGSWSGGIFELEMDKITGKVIYPGSNGTTSGGNSIDKYFGTKISGGYTESGEGPFVVYDNISHYYYLYVTYAGLGATGGYNMRMFRSTKPDGPYIDAAGNNAVLTSRIDNASIGIKLIGNYQFKCLVDGYRAGGHNSSFIDSDGQMYLIYHTRFNNGTEYHELRVHQMFKNEDGWPVVAPYEYDGDVISTTGYSMDKISGTYEFINHGNSNNGIPMITTLSVSLNSDKTITGDATGIWSSIEGSNYMSIIINGVTYKGVFFEQQDESNNVSKVMTFSAIGSNNQSVWGSKMGTNLKSLFTTPSSVNLSWSSFGDNARITSYNIYNNSILVGSSSTNNYTVNGLTEKTAYNFTVRAKDANGNLFAKSNILNIITPATETPITMGDTVALSAGWYYIKNVNANKDLQVATNIGKATQNVEIGTPLKYTGQKWYLTNVGNGYVTLKSGLGNYMLDVYNGDNTDGANIQIYNAYGNDPQKFSVKSSSTSGAYAIATMASNQTKVLDDYKAGTSDGTNVCQWTYNGRNNQLWTFEPTSEPSLVGDVNGDTKINILDYVLMKKYIASIIKDFPNLDDDIWAGDINGDGVVDNTDCGLLKNQLLKK